MSFLLRFPGIAVPDRSVTMPTTRRSVLDWLLGVGVTGWVASVAYPVLRYLTPLAKGAGGAVKLSAEDVARLERGQFTIVRSGDARVMVFLVAGALRALDARCTHEGCTVQFVPGERVVWCACHNGRFDVDGRVLAGPPPRPLRKWMATRDADGGVTVTREKA
ncbi:MAG TPA: Rieske 2Fe-2S domain-containing protein [Myxococcales bacterium]|nr:Rieske 2Fe-2S domain-containing protein [Myxococcales bacterium]